MVEVEGVTFVPPIPKPIIVPCWPIVPPTADWSVVLPTITTCPPEFVARTNWLVKLVPRRNCPVALVRSTS